MPRGRTSPHEVDHTRGKPASTPEELDHEMINLAVDLTRRQLRDGTASAQVITHYLKLGSNRERLEQARLEMEVELLRTKRETIESEVRAELLYGKVVSALKLYNGQPLDEQEEEEYYD
jgi:hypothetical protein